MYRILFYKSKKLTRDKKHLSVDKKSKEKILQIIRKLALDPFGKDNLNTKKLVHSGESGVFRLKIGKYRIIYDVDTSNRILIIYRIKLRKEGYK